LEYLSEQGEATVVVVSDLRMPEMKGSDFLVEVRARHPQIVTILLTGFPETDEIVKAVKAGIFSYILKPWDRDYLLSELQKAYDHGELRRQNERYLRTMEEELKWAGEMQKAILKPALPRTEGIEFLSCYKPVPSLYCGGDYYDVIPLSADRFLLLIGDVAGHGVRAAFVTGILKAIIYSEYIRPTIGKDFSPGAFLGWLNDRMNFELRSSAGLIITFFAGVLDKKSGSLRYANAGQTHPFAVGPGGAVELAAPGFGIGFADSAEYPERTAELSDGDALTLYTDGLVEPGASGGHAPVDPGKLFSRVEYGPDFHGRLLAAALEESGCAEFDDDVTLVTALLRRSR
jgi:sigma-B regulation protein RsbU (phosphoserine phosphatase)